MKAGEVVEYKCHAGLSCFAKPVEIGGKRNLAVIGGRAFVKSSDYQQLMERFRTGDLQSIASDEVFANILFSDRQRLMNWRSELIVLRIDCTTLSSNGSGAGHTTPAEKVVQPPARVEAAKASHDLEQEVQRLRSELEYRTRFTDSLQHFLERISCADPVKTYNSIVTNSKELLRSERASLMVLDEAANELVLKAASGLTMDPSSVAPCVSAKAFPEK